MWSTSHQVLSVLNCIRGDGTLGSLNTFHRLCSSLVFMVLSLVPFLDAVYQSPIACVTDSPMIHAIEMYCLIQGIFTIQEGEKTVNELSYYIWTPYVMLLCFLSSNVGHLMYKVLNGHVIDRLLDTLKNFQKVKSFRQKLLTRDRIKADSFCWVVSLMITEIITFAMPALQVYCLNLLLDGKFLLLGLQNCDEIDKIFSKLVKCTFYKYGPSGTLQNHDSLCVLANNILNDKIYFCAWVWLAVAIILSVAAFAWRLMTLLCFKLTCFNCLLWRNGKHCKQTSLGEAFQNY